MLRQADAPRLAAEYPGQHERDERDHEPGKTRRDEIHHVVEPGAAPSEPQIAAASCSPTIESIVLDDLEEHKARKPAKDIPEDAS